MHAPRLRIPFAWAAPAAFLIGLPGARAAEDAETPIEQSRYVIGASATSAPEYSGSDRRVTKLRPLWAYQYGRFRISTSRASSVLGFASDAAGPGASAELFANQAWRLGVALRFDSGRSASDSSNLTGMPDIRRTLRGKLYTSYRLGEHWNLNGSVSQDLLGRQGGALAGLDLGYSWWLSDRTEFTSGAGVSMGNAQYMTTYFGVPQEAARSGRPAFSPGAGTRDVHLGVGVMTALTPSWILFANVGATRLLSDAAASPLTRQAASSTASIGLAYRCCK